MRRQTSRTRRPGCSICGHADPQIALNARESLPIESDLYAHGADLSTNLFGAALLVPHDC